MLRTVTTKYGDISGVASGDPRITVFWGVPYAKPPVGKLRFSAPQPLEPWEGTYQADRKPPIAMQPQPGEDWTDFYTKELNPTGYEYTLSEDCLYLNIWSPAKSAEEKLPVFFYIHGGGFTAGYPFEVEFDGERVARNDVIFVTVGYRLNAFGFFSHPELRDECPGNQGLLDQIMALRWVRENIRAFGGDPDRVTICGQSAGGMSVASILNSPLSEGLVSGGIMMSGGGLRPPKGGVGPWLSMEDAESYGLQLMEAVGAKNLAELREIPAGVIMRTALGRWKDGKNGPLRWRPVIDGCFFKEELRDAIISGRNLNVPIMIGCCRGENRPRGGFFGAPTDLASFKKMVCDNYGDKAEELLSLCDLSSEEAFKDFYYNEIGLSAGYTGAMAYARNNARLGRKAWTFVFDHDIPGDDAGSFHGSDMWFVFDSVGHSWRPFTGKHYDLARQVSSYWANFVKYGDPNGCDRIGDPLPEWKPFDDQDEFTICFKDAPEKFDEGNEELKRLTQNYFIEG